MTSTSIRRDIKEQESFRRRCHGSHFLSSATPHVDFVVSNGWANNILLSASVVLRIAYTPLTEFLQCHSLNWEQRLGDMVLVSHISEVRLEALTRALSWET